MTTCRHVASSLAIDMVYCYVITFMNSTLESSGLSKRKSSKKFSSIGSSWASCSCVFTRIRVFVDRRMVGIKVICE